MTQTTTATPTADQIASAIKADEIAIEIHDGNPALVFSAMWCACDDSGCVVRYAPDEAETMDLIAEARGMIETADAA